MIDTGSSGGEHHFREAEVRQKYSQLLSEINGQSFASLENLTDLAHAAAVALPNRADRTGLENVIFSMGKLTVPLQIDSVTDGVFDAITVYAARIEPQLRNLCGSTASPEYIQEHASDFAVIARSPSLRALIERDLPTGKTRLKIIDAALQIENGQRRSTSFQAIRNFFNRSG